MHRFSTFTYRMRDDGGGEALLGAGPAFPEFGPVSAVSGVFQEFGAIAKFAQLVGLNIHCSKPWETSISWGHGSRPW